MNNTTNALCIVSITEVVQGDTLVTISKDILGQWTVRTYREVLEVTRLGKWVIRLQLHNEAIQRYRDEKVVIVER